MNKALTIKKHSNIIAKLALKNNIIDKKLFNELYYEAFCSYGRPKRKNKYGYKFSKYYIELYFCVVDYYGEADEISLINHIRDHLFYTLNVYDSEKNEFVKPVKYFGDTKDIIKYLRKIKKIKKILDK